MKKTTKKRVKSVKAQAKKATAPKAIAPYKSVKALAQMCIMGEKPHGAYLSMNVGTGLASFVCGPKKAPHAVAADIPVALAELAKVLGLKVVYVE